MLNLLKTKKLLAVCGVAMIFSIIVTFILSVVVDYWFVEPIRDEQFRTMFHAGEILVPPANSGSRSLELSVEWPRRAIIFYYGALACYWFSLGFYIKNKFSAFPRKLLVFIPLLPSVIVIRDYFFPLHIFFCLLGSIYKYKCNDGKRERD